MQVKIASPWKVTVFFDFSAVACFNVLTDETLVASLPSTLSLIANGNVLSIMHYNDATMRDEVENFLESLSVKGIIGE